jgi:phage N-6-adenine-methyltransferase
MAPKQKPHRSRQDYETPDELLQAVQRRWGPFSLDLAAREDNKKAPLCFTPEQDSLLQHWHKVNGLLWLNPPFSNIGEWAAKCASESTLGAKIVMLTPASVGSEWFAKHCHQRAQVVFLRPRLTFKGCKDPYPKDCMLTLWGFPGPAGYENWRWK